jgi:hypothetical protein
LPFFITPAFLDMDPFFVWPSAGLFAGFLAAGVFLAGELDLAVELAELFDAALLVAAFFVGALGFLTPAPVLAVFFVVVFFAAAFFSLLTTAAAGVNLSGAPGSVPSRWRVTRLDVDFFGGDGFGGWGFG